MCFLFLLLLIRIPPGIYNVFQRTYHYRVLYIVPRYHRKAKRFWFFLEEVEILVFPRNRGTICVDSHMEGGFYDEKEM